jgi:hypothetical protein
MLFIIDHLKRYVSQSSSPSFHLNTEGLWQFDVMKRFFTDIEVSNFCGGIKITFVACGEGLRFFNLVKDLLPQVGDPFFSHELGTDGQQVPDQPSFLIGNRYTVSIGKRIRTTRKSFDPWSWIRYDMGSLPDRNELIVANSQFRQLLGIQELSGSLHILNQKRRKAICIINEGKLQMGRSEFSQLINRLRVGQASA